MKKLYKWDMNADYFYDKAADLADEGNPEKAIYNYYRSLSLEPFNPWTMSDIGMCYYEMGVASEALEWFNRALAIDKNCYVAAFGIVQIMTSAGRFSVAERFIPLCSREDLDGYMESGEFFGAADNGDFGERFKLVDKDAGVRKLEAATAALAAGKIPEAEEYLRAVLPESKAYCEAAYYLALICYDKGDFAEALKISEKMLRVCPGEIKTYIIRLAVCSRLGMSEDEKAAADKLSKLSAGDFAEAVGVAYCLSDIGMYDIAVRFYEEAVKLQPYHKSALLLLAACYHNAEKHDKCREVMVRLCRLYPEDGVAAYYAKYTFAHPDAIIPLVSDLNGRAAVNYIGEFLREVNEMETLEELEDKYDADDGFYDRMMAFFASGVSGAIINFVGIIAPSKRLRPILRELLARSNVSLQLKIECLTLILVYDRKKEIAVVGDDGAVEFIKASVVAERNETARSVFCRAYSAMKIARIDADKELRHYFSAMKNANYRLVSDCEYSLENAAWLCSAALGGGVSEKICKLLGADGKKFIALKKQWESIENV